MTNLRIARKRHRAALLAWLTDVEGVFDLAQAVRTLVPGFRRVERARRRWGDAFHPSYETTQRARARYWRRIAGRHDWALLAAAGEGNLAYKLRAFEIQARRSPKTASG